MSRAIEPLTARFELLSELIEPPNFSSITPFEFVFYSIDCAAEKESYRYRIGDEPLTIEFAISQGPDYDVNRSV